MTDSESPPASEVGFASRRVELTRRRMYLFGLPLVALSGMGVWFFERWAGTLPATNAYGLPMLSIFCLLAVPVLLFQRERFREVEVALLGAFAVFLLGSLMVNSSDVFHTDQNNIGTLSRLGYWFPPLYGMAFLVFGMRGGLIFSAGVWTVSVILGVNHFIRPVGHEGEELLVLAQTYMSNLLVIGLLGATSNIVRIRTRAAVELEVAAHTDPLTGLDNRRGLERVIAVEIERAERHGRPMALLFFDLDRFKAINDHFGHDAGDQVLKALRPLLRDHLRGVDSLGRWGGEEFLVVVPELDAAAARTLAERLRRVIEAHDFPEVGRVTASFGVAAHEPGDTPLALVERADRALYTAKSLGRNRVA